MSLWRNQILSIRRTSVGAFAALAAIAVGGPTPARAQASPNGVEFQVNSYTPSAQRDAALAVDPTGGFVVVWASSGSYGNDDSYFSIQLQRYNAAGAPVAGELQVNSDTAGSQLTPAIASAISGQFVVAWTSSESSGTDNSYGSVHARLFDGGGAPAGLQFQVNTYITQNQIDPVVASDAVGNFVVVWQSYGSTGSDADSASIQAQRYDAAGVPVGAEFQVNTYTTLTQYTPAVASDSQGNFVVVWSSGGASAGDTASYSIQARRYLANGTPLSSELQLNSYTTGDQLLPAVSVDGAGNFVVAWRSLGSGGTDHLGTSIHARRFDASGNALGAEFQVNTYTTNDQTGPAVAIDTQGDFVIAWSSAGSSNTDTSGYSTQAQRYRADGAPLGAQFQVNSYTTSNQNTPDLASDANGNFVVAWQSSGSSGTDSSFLSVQGQRYDGLFRDGFENSGTSRWSATVP